ncbi:hypothetical protein RXV95_10175 [Novosphingobium sp. ZN18A2]|uniref:hypothetical protein n=1 Tax=Novosphingobium sp. ZN18A2 TaxID=3079861 RepID=UPI0030CDB226
MTVWEGIFWAAAAYNLVIGVPGMLRGDSVEARVIGVLVAAFGIVYAFVATDPVRFAPMLWAGVFGKVGVVALMGPAAAKGQGPKGLGLILAGDAAFALAFLVFLLG